MSWIAGVLDKDTKETREKIALMVEAAYPWSGSLGNEHLWMASSVSEDMNGRALAQVSPPIPGKPLEYPYSDYQGGLISGCDGYLYNFQKEGFDPSMVKEIGYSNDKITTEKLGSSERYGYRYAEEKLWQVPQHVQLFSHTLAYRKGLLNKSTRNRTRYFIDKTKHTSC